MIALLKGDWAEVADGRVETATVVERLDVLEQFGAGRRAIGENAVGALNFEGGKPAFGHSIVETVAFTAHTGTNPVGFEQSLKVVGGVLRTAVRVMDETGWRPTLLESHLHGIDDQLTAHVLTHRPANHTAREQVNDDRQVEPPLPSCDVGDVAAPDAIGCADLEVLLEQVRCDRQTVITVGGHLVASRSSTSDTTEPHQSSNPLAVVAIA